MKAVAVSVLALVALMVAAAAAPARGGLAPGASLLRAPSAMSPVADCARGTTRARIGGRIQCLRGGQRCDPRFNTTNPSYKRYGFLCTSRASNEPTTLFRIAQPGRAPRTCPGIGPTPTSTPPGFQGTWVGESPFWLFPYLRRDQSVSVWRYSMDIGLKGSDGWSVKVIWLLARTVTGTARVSITNLASSRRLSITIGGTRSTAPLLDPSRPGHPDVDSKPDTHEWGSYVVFPRAGCYRLEAQWPQDSWRLIFSFGR